MKSIGLLSAWFLASCIVLTLPAGAQVRQSWAAQYSAGDTVRDRVYGMAVDATGNVYVTGSGPYTNHFGQYQTVKFGSDGRLRWAVRYRAGTNGNSYGGRALCVDAAGHCYVTGYSRTNDEYAAPSQVTTVKYDSEGRELWVARHGTRHDNYATALALDSAGNAYVAGVALQGGGYLTAKINAAGNVEWAREFPAGLANAVVPDSAGNVFVTGDNGGDMLTLKYDPEGALLWSRTFDTPGQPSWTEKGYALATDAAGNVFVAGGGTVGFITLKYSNGNGGTLLWYSILPSGQPSQFSEWVPRQIAVDNAGNVIVAGNVQAQSELMEWGLAKYSSSGSNQWSRFIHLVRFQNDSLEGMVVDGDGAIYVTGSGETGTNTMFIVTRKYAPDGTELWRMLYKDPVMPYARPCGLALDRQGNVIVAGEVTSVYQTNTDLVVIKYEQAQTAAHLQMVSFGPNAGARLSLFAQSNATYTIEASADLKDWTSIGTAPNPTGTVEFNDPAVPGVTQRFYRARSP